MSDVEQMSDAPTPHARIWLTPPCCGNYEHGEVTWCQDAVNECGNCGAQPTEYLHSALAPYRAAEILAAEANERARALGQAAEHINRLEAALRGLLSTVERLDISEGVCCCGDDMATHAEPMSCGHTPVDAGHYHHGNAIQQARDAIEHGAGK